MGDVTIARIGEAGWAMAGDTRRTFLERFADTSTPAIGTHFAAPTRGRRVRDCATYRLDVCAADASRHFARPACPACSRPSPRLTIA
ncbi:hypothetical protein [Burkholderia stagnalis]|uniref:hypothetical protein n=1 Tax=Burkholderia stagnalis TaxID=1503054 RepID=UPI000F7FACF0|nr:hypothetical protein [Burkholderia stagnalis]